MTAPRGSHLGPYEILDPLGAGGMGEVYRARDTRLDRIVAIKILPLGVADDPETRQRFEREARTISQINHPHICTLHDVGRQEGVDYLVFEHLEGETLAHRISRGSLPPAHALQIAIDICDALDTAHGLGITHRDLKPANVMLIKGGPSRLGLPPAKLLDFGLAKARVAVPGGGSATPETSGSTRAGPLTMQGMILGTVQYMAPELLEGRDADARSDIWAFGCVLYEMLAGAAPFRRDLAGHTDCGHPGARAPAAPGAAAGDALTTVGRHARVPREGPGSSLAVGPGPVARVRDGSLETSRWLTAHRWPRHRRPPQGSAAGKYCSRERSSSCVARAQRCGRRAPRRCLRVPRDRQ